MRITSLTFFAVALVACSEPAPVDLIEITVGASEMDRLNHAGLVISELLQQGFPNTDCGTEDDPIDGCDGAISLRQLHVQPVTAEPSGRVYLKCVVHDESAYFELVRVCVDRVREQIRIISRDAN